MTYFLAYHNEIDPHCTMSNTRDQRPLNPSSHLTATFNAAHLVLSSHQESITQAQKACDKAAADAECTHAALEAQQISPTTTPALSKSNTPSLTLTIPPDSASIDAAPTNHTHNVTSWDHCTFHCCSLL